MVSRLFGRGGAVLLATAALFILGSGGVRALADSDAPMRASMIWMISGRSLVRLSALPGTSGLVQRFFGSPHSSIVVAPWGAALPHLRGARSESFASYLDMRQKLSHRDGRAFRIAVLDLERWPLTPSIERRRPALYYRLAGTLARRGGVMLVATPSPNLVYSPALGGAKTYGRFLASGLIGRIARSADVFEVQAQGLERSTARYARFVKAAADQARDANPRVLVIAGLSTNPSGHAVPASRLLNDVFAVGSYVDGFWLNIPARSRACPRCGVAHPKEAQELLRSLARRRRYDPAAAAGRFETPANGVPQLRRLSPG